MNLALIIEFSPTIQESNFKYLELYALDHGIIALIIHDSFRDQFGHYNAIASTLQN